MRITKTTAKKLVRLHCADLPGTVEIDSDTITLWLDSRTDDAESDAVDKASTAIMAALPSASATSCNGKTIIHYKKAQADMGDWNDRSSRWHY